MTRGTCKFLGDVVWKKVRGVKKYERECKLDDICLLKESERVFCSKRKEYLKIEKIKDCFNKKKCYKIK